MQSPVVEKILYQKNYWNILKQNVEAVTLIVDQSTMTIIFQNKFKIGKVVNLFRKKVINYI